MHTGTLIMTTMINISQVDRKGNYDQNTDDRLRFNMGRQYPNTPEYVGFGSEGNNIMYIPA